LGTAMQMLRQLWGEAEFRRLAGSKVAELPPQLRTLFDTDATLAAALPAAAALGDLPGPAREAAVEVLGQSTLMQLLRQIMLQVIGGLGVEYLTSVEALRTSIGLEAYAQRDPLVAYKAKASEMYEQLTINIRSGIVARAYTYRPRIMAESAAAASGRAAQIAAAAAAPAGRRRPFQRRPARGAQPGPQRPVLVRLRQEVQGLSLGPRPRRPRFGRASRAFGGHSAQRAGHGRGRAGGSQQRRGRRQAPPPAPLTRCDAAIHGLPSLDGQAGRLFCGRTYSVS